MPPSGVLMKLVIYSFIGDCTLRKRNLGYLVVHKHKVYCVLNRFLSIFSVMSQPEDQSAALIFLMKQLS